MDISAKSIITHVQDQGHYNKDFFECPGTIDGVALSEDKTILYSAPKLVYYLDREGREQAEYRYPTFKSYNIPNSVLGIYRHAFADCNYLHEINLPSKLVAIGYGAFENCYNLKEINIPNNVEYIGDLAFYGCYNLKSITLPNKLKYLGTACFDLCEDIDEIVIPEGITELNGSEFGCTCKKLFLPSTLNKIHWSSLPNVHEDGYIFVPFGTLQHFLGLLFQKSIESKYKPKQLIELPKYIGYLRV